MSINYLPITVQQHQWTISILGCPFNHFSSLIISCWLHCKFHHPSWMISTDFSVAGTGYQSSDIFCFLKQRKRKHRNRLHFFSETLSLSNFSCTIIYTKSNTLSDFAKLYSADDEENHAHWKIPWHTSKPRQTLGLIKTCDYASSNISPLFSYRFYIMFKGGTMPHVSISKDKKVNWFDYFQ